MRTMPYSIVGLIHKYNTTIDCTLSFRSRVWRWLLDSPKSQFDQI